MIVTSKMKTPTYMTAPEEEWSMDERQFNRILEMCDSPHAEAQQAGQEIYQKFAARFTQEELYKMYQRIR